MKSIVKKILSYRQAFFKKIDKDFYSQFGEDKILKELIPKVKTKGFYVDVGCFHPKIHKECYFLICKKCNIYQECCDKNLTDNIFKTADKRDFIVSNTTLEIEGHCQGCVEK